MLAVCSCTILPLFAGIYKKGAGIGPATAFLYSGPGINILAIVLTAGVLGLELGLAWSPCAISLIIPMFVWIVAGGYSWLVSSGLLFVFGLGHGVPIIPLAVAGRTARRNLAGRPARIDLWVTRVFDIVVISFGIILMLRFWGQKLW